MNKNQPLNGLTFLLLNKANAITPVTSGDVTGYIVKDGGEQALLSGNITHIANGLWKIDTITAEEMNADAVGLVFEHADAFPVHYCFLTRAAGSELDVDLSDHNIAGTLGAKLNDIVFPTGQGAIETTYHLTDNASNDIAGANVWVTSDLAGNTIVASGITDDNGLITFYLTAGTFYIWRRKAGYTFDNPLTAEVS